MESLQRALSRGGLRKNAESEKHAQKSEEKKVVSGLKPSLLFQAKPCNMGRIVSQTVKPVFQGLA